MVLTVVSKTLTNNIKNKNKFRTYRILLRSEVFDFLYIGCEDR